MTGTMGDEPAMQRGAGERQIANRVEIQASGVKPTDELRRDKKLPEFRR